MLHFVRGLHGRQDFVVYFSGHPISLRLLGRQEFNRKVSPSSRQLDVDNFCLECLSDLDGGRILSPMEQKNGFLSPWVGKRKLINLIVRYFGW